MSKLKYIIAFLLQVVLISTILLGTRSCKKDRENKAWTAITLPVLDLHLGYTINCQDVFEHKK